MKVVESQGLIARSRFSFTAAVGDSWRAAKQNCRQIAPLVTGTTLSETILEMGQ